MSVVVDASVALKWVVPEVLSEHADSLLAGDEELIAPDLLLVEAANALWKKRRRGELSASEAATCLGTLMEAGVVTHPTGPLLARALVLAERLDHPVYDCSYVALAERERATLVTADERLLGKLRRRRMRVVDLRSIDPR